jgi:putative transcriptional regulator
MSQILQSKNVATKFQILVEIAANQPTVQQKDIAGRLKITPQAVSDYVKELVANGWLNSQGRSKYRVTPEGVAWILTMARQLQNYSSFVGKVVRDISISTAIAEGEISASQSVSLYMRNGLLFATANVNNEGARGVAISAAKDGEDVGVSNIEGVIKLETGIVTIASIPTISDGGSRNIDATRLKEISKQTLIGAIGIEAQVALKRTGTKPDYLYGVKEAAVEAAMSGLPFLVVCVENEVSALGERLKRENLVYNVIELKKHLSLTFQI